MRKQTASLFLPRLTVALPVAFLAALPVPTVAQAPPTNTVEINGHYVGEPVERFLRLEPQARAEVEVCRDHPERSACIHLINAVQAGKRAELSTSKAFNLDNIEADAVTINFVLDGGKLVKISMLTDDASDLTKNLGHPSSEKAIPTQNSSGTKWENHLTVWETKEIYVALYQDNNPSLKDRRLSLEAETPAEHARDNPEPQPAKPDPAPDPSSHS